MQRSTLYGAVLVICGLAAYSNSFQGEFFFDDNGTVKGNPYITKLWPLGDAFRAPPRTTNSGRPVPCFSLAVNYQLSGMSVAGFRTGNLLIHLLAGLLLLGVVRQTLREGGGIPLSLKENAGAIAFAVALSWTLHPVNSVLVNYIAQRCELLMAFFFLLTLYCSIRSWQPAARRGLWQACAVLACLCGMGSKEVMVGAPLLVLLYDRTFSAGSFSEALRRSKGLYAGLAATWLLLIALVLSGGTAEGARVSKLPWTALDYFLSQPRALLHYVWLMFIPRNLSFDYGWPAAASLNEALLPLLLIGLLGVLSIVAIVRRPAVGFLGAWFFVTLAPTSSFMPLPDIAVEYRMYLAMPAVFAAVYCVLAMLLSSAGTMPRPSAGAAGAGIVFVSAVLGVLTFQRNEVYRSSASVWLDVVRKHPANARGHANLGIALAERGQIDVAMSALTRAEQLNPTNPDVLANLGALLARTGKPEKARELLERAVTIEPGNVMGLYNLANMYSELGRKDEAAQLYSKALGIKPDFIEARLNFGIDLFEAKKYGEAERHFSEILRLNPVHGSGVLMLSRTLAASGRRTEARRVLTDALAKNPQLEEARRELAGYPQDGR
ncbi:MAG TPA: tetratricopeptide repeat protein [Planctomycetota bacterium]|nr:tetratricopeptide repeat protein [Planctomycetota bacterium]